jgi:hypothetical protein
VDLLEATLTRGKMAKKFPEGRLTFAAYNKIDGVVIHRAADRPLDGDRIGGPRNRRGGVEQAIVVDFGIFVDVGVSVIIH